MKYAVLLCVLFLSACSGTGKNKHNDSSIEETALVNVCFLSDGDLNLGDKLNVVLSKRRADQNLHVVEEYPYIGAHLDSKGDRCIGVSLCLEVSG